MSTKKKHSLKKATKLKDNKHSKRSVVKESLRTFVNDIVNGKPESAKAVLKSVIEQKIKQKIINNNNAKLF